MPLCGGSGTSVTAVSSQVSARSRRCSRASCSGPAVATLTYVYADSTAVLGPLATYAEPHGYDLCQVHAARLTAPRGWQVIRLADNFDPPDPTPDDLEALADAVREAARPRPAPGGRSEGSGRRPADGAAPAGRDHHRRHPGRDPDVVSAAGTAPSRGLSTPSAAAHGIGRATGSRPVRVGDRDLR